MIINHYLFFYIDEINPIVIDNGSSISKAGFGGEENPRSIISSVIGKLRRTIDQVGNSRDSYIGNEISWRTGILSLEYPIEHGIVYNWDSLEKIWDYQFHHELKVDPAEHPILLTEIGDAYKSQREKMIQLMFETFNVPYFYIECQSVLSMISSGSLTGLSFESGEGCSYAIPVYDGYKIPHAIKKSKVAGKVLNEWLNHLLREDGKYFDSSSEKEIIRDIKEEACYVSLDYIKEIKIIDSYYYKLPDENYISFREERIKCPELLFNPDLYTKEKMMEFKRLFMIQLIHVTLTFDKIFLREL